MAYHLITSLVGHPSLIISNDTALDITILCTRARLFAVTLARIVLVVSYLAELIRHSAEAEFATAAIW